MKKTIILSSFPLIIGIGIGFFGFMAYYGSELAKFRFMFQVMEVIEFEEAAVDAYHNQPPEVAIWALEYNVNSMNTIKEQRASADVENPYILLTPDISLVFSHGRLSQLYKKLNNEEKYLYHLEKAIAINNETRNYKIETEEKLIDIINKVDAGSDIEVEK